MKDVLVLFSGGKDSFLSTLLMIEQGYKVHLVTYDNGCELNCRNVLNGARKLQRKYGKDRVHILGIKKTDSIWRELVCNFYNYDFDYIKKEFGNMSISQFNCMSCRVAMYILSIIICKQMNINVVVDGARKSQMFAVEQEPVLKEFIKLFKNYNIDIKFPVLDEKDDFRIKNLILAHGFVPKMNEAQCLLGMPINDRIDMDIINGCINIINKEIIPKIEKIIKNYEKVNFTEDYK